MFYLTKDYRVINLAEAVEIYVEGDAYSDGKYEVVANYSTNGRRTDYGKRLFGGTKEQCEDEFKKIILRFVDSKQLVQGAK